MNWAGIGFMVGFPLFILATCIAVEVMEQRMRMRGRNGNLPVLRK